jgi:hypothetical protein
LDVGFQFHLPYKTTNGEDASLVIATGPNVSVNTILGLLFMQRTGMILDLVNNMAECKYLDCPPFLIDFQCTSNHVLVTDDPSANVQLVESTKIIEVIKCPRLTRQSYGTGSAFWNKVSGTCRLD